jgi:hypothetical protein
MSSTALIIIEWTALVIGICGTVLWSLGKNQFAVSLLWMISAILWIVFAVMNEHYGLIFRDFIGVILYAIGIKTYWLKSKKD